MKNKMNAKVNKAIKFKRIFLFLLICIWAVMVFNFSSQNGEESSGLSRKIVEIFIKSEEIVDKVEPYARKIAHFSEYALGGMLFTALFNTYSWPDRKIIATSILLGIWYAITDEFHQLLVPDRHGSFFDVYLDSLGFATGVFCMILIIKRIKQIKNKR